MRHKNGTVLTAVGLYENQDPGKADMNLRGKFTTDAEGRFWFSTVKVVGYPIPKEGVVGCLLNAQNRHPYRPAHLHALIFKPGFKTLISQVYDPPTPTSIRTCSLASPGRSWATRCVMRSRVRAIHPRQRPGIRSTTPTLWSKARRSCRARRSSERLRALARR